MALSGNRPKTKIQSAIQQATAIGKKSQDISVRNENVCGDVEDPHELVPDTSEVQKSADCLTVQSR